MKKILPVILTLIPFVFYAQEKIAVFSIDRIYSSKYDVLEDVNDHKLIVYEDSNANIIYIKLVVNGIEKKDRFIVFGYDKDETSFTFKVRDDIDGTIAIIVFEKIFDDRYKIYLVKSEKNFLILFGKKEFLNL